MNNTKFSSNALLVIVLIFSTIGLFVTVKLYDMAAHVVIVNQMTPIESSDVSVNSNKQLWVRYSTLDPSGIYEGPENTTELKVEGDFGSGWGAALTGRYLYINKYSYTDVGMTLCDLVRIDTDTYDCELIRKNTILRGRCASGELVCVCGTLLPVNKPETNSLIDLYSMTSPDVSKDGKGTVLFIDPDSSEVVYSIPDQDPMARAFNKMYLDRTLEEVMK